MPPDDSNPQPDISSAMDLRAQQEYWARATEWAQRYGLAEEKIAISIQQRDAAFGSAAEQFMKFAASAPGVALGISGAAAALDLFVNNGQGIQSISDGVTAIGEKIKSAYKGLNSLVAPFIDQGVKLFRGYLAPLESLYGVMASKAAELLNNVDFAQAREEVRKSFGDLARAEAKSVLSSYSDMRKSASSLAGTTLSMSKVFGRGPAGAADALKYFNQLAMDLGPTFSILRGEIEKNADQMLIYQKGLGLTGEQMRSIANKAIATGRPIEEGLKEISRLAVTMGGKFNISSKLIGRDLGYMSQNVAKFGSMTKTQMATAAVYTKKLGLEIKDVEGLIDKFDDFETAATGASKLAQAFGMNVDALQMMKEQDPSKRLDMLRQAFASTGKSIENMSRQERLLLAETSGLDANMVELALSAKNMGMSYSEIQKEAQKSGKEQKSQAEIMESLSKNIERVVQSMGYEASFIGEFFKGFVEGISMTLGFKDGLKGIMEGLRLMRDLGREVGKVFGDKFPGVSDLLRSIGDTVRGLTTDLSGATSNIGTFFASFSSTEGAEASMEKLFKGLNNFVSGSTDQAFGNVFTAYNKFLMALVRGMKAAIPHIKDKALEIIDSLVDSFMGLASTDNQSTLAWAVADLFGAANDAWEPIREKLEPLFDKALNWFKGIFKDEGGAAGTGLGTQLMAAVEAPAAAAGDNIIAGLHTSLTKPENLAKIKDAFNTVLNEINPFLDELNTISGLLGYAAGASRVASSPPTAPSTPAAPATATANVTDSTVVADQAKNEEKINAARRVFDDLTFMENKMRELNTSGGLATISDFLFSVVSSLDNWYINSFAESWFFWYIDVIKSGFDSFSDLTRSMIYVSGDLNSIVEKTVDSSAIENYFNNLEKNIDVLSSHTKKMTDGHIGEIARAAATELIEMHKALADVPEINVSATIAKLNNKLGFTNEVLKVEKKPIVLNVSLDLTMKAEDLTETVFRTDAKLRKQGGDYAEARSTDFGGT